MFQPTFNHVHNVKENRMKKRNFRRMMATASLVLGVSGVGPAHADIFGGFLGAAAGATDVYGMTCPIGTISVRANVNDGAAAGVQVSVHMINPNGGAATASAVDGGGPSALATLAGGAGNYLVAVDKDAAINEGYVVAMDCHNAAGAIAGNQAVLVQNQ
jgi:hypothetical protein